MKILAINSGSSSLKFSLFNMDDESIITSGLFERIGIDGSNYTIKYNGEEIKMPPKEFDLLYFLAKKGNIYHTSRVLSQ